jgi:peptide/nickel transport system substrate-binding protein
MRRRTATATALLALVLAGCTSPSGDGAAGRRTGSGGRFVYAIPGEPTTLNLVSGTDAWSLLVQRLVADSLVDHDETLKAVPRLASSWDFSPDGRVLTFHLHPSVRFHDGAPFSSRDVLYTYEKILDPASHAVGRRDAFLPVLKVEAPDGLTVRVTYRHPYAPALRGWEVPILPRHIYEKEDFAASPHNRAPIGTGPFRFVSWQAGQRIVLAANLDYWGGPPALDTFVFQFIPSEETALQALLAGEIDYARISPAQWTSQSPTARFQRRFRSIRFVPLFFYYIAWRGDGSNPFFADHRVRQALSLALDRGGYVRSVLRGLGEVASSPFHPLVLEADPGAAATPYDPARAEALLDAAGWRRDPRTGLRTRAGIPFQFELLIFGGGQDHVQFSQVAQESLRAIGVGMSIARLDWPALLSRLQKGDFQAAMSGTVPGLDPDASYGMLHSSQIQGGQNYAAFHDGQVDEALEEGRRTLDPEARQAIYRRIEARVREMEPYSFLFYPVVQAAVSSRVRDVVPSPIGILGYYPGAARFRVAGEDER